MAKRLPKTDVVIVGGGATGLVSAYELAHAGRRCVVLERGPMRRTAPSLQSPQQHDELLYGVRHRNKVDVSRNTLTFRNNRHQRACRCAASARSCRAKGWAAR